MSDQDTPRSEVEALPADPLFNPAHPDYAGWAGEPTPSSPPAEPAPSSSAEPPSSGGDEDEKPAQQPATATQAALPSRKR